MAEADVISALQDCDDRISEMRSAQNRHSHGMSNEREALVRRGRRKFSDEHVAFLNAAYCVCDYLKRSIHRVYLQLINELIEEPIVALHRKLRNRADHATRIDYNLSFPLEQFIAIGAPSTFPTPLLSQSLSRGIVNIETKARVGKAFFTLNPASLNPEETAALSAVMSAGGLEPSPGVLLLAEMCDARLNEIVIRAQTNRWFR